MLYPMCLDSFPAGDKLGKFPTGEQWVRNITKGDEILMGPTMENAALLIDPSNGTVARAFRLRQVDLYGQTLVSETANGGMALKEPSSTSVETIELPSGPLPSLAAGGFSQDGRFLAYSHSSRGSVWDLAQNKQVSRLRRFSSLHFDDQNRMQIHVIASFQHSGANLMLEPTKGTQSPGAAFVEGQELLSGTLVYFKPLDKGYNGVVNNFEMQVSDPFTGKLLWTRHFPNGKPGLNETDGDSLAVVNNLRTDEAAGEANRHTDKLVKSSDTLKEWIANGLMIEILNARTGEVRRILQTPTRPVWESDAQSVDIFGDYVAVHGNLNNTVVYRLSDGMRTCAFYGRVLGGDGKRGLLAVSNRDQEMVVYDDATGNEVKHVILDHKPRAVGFVTTTNSLRVLTATQQVYTVPLADSASAK